MTSLFVSRLEIIETDEEATPKAFLIDLEFTFQSDQSEKYLQEKTVVFFGKNSSSLIDKADGEREIIETSDYGLFELDQEEE